MTTMKVLNQERYERIKTFITEYVDGSGNSPTLDEIAAGTGISRTAVVRYVNRMVEVGEMDSDGYRSLKPSDTKFEAVRVPILGQVACGLPKLAEENIEEYVRLPVALFGRGKFYILRAVGDSMINAGIDDGDLVLIRQQPTAEVGQIVVALVEDEATLKRYYPEHDHIRLHPENPELEDIIVPSCEIQGVAVKVLKDLE